MTHGEVALPPLFDPCLFLHEIEGPLQNLLSSTYIPTLARYLLRFFDELGTFVKPPLEQRLIV